MKRRQSRHIRKSKKGKKYWAGKGSKRVTKRKSAKKSLSTEIPVRLRKIIFKEELENKIKELKKQKRTVLPEIGILKLKTKKATKSRMGINPFTKAPMKIKAKPARKVVKLRVSKSLKEMIA